METQFSPNLLKLAYLKKIKKCGLYDSSFWEPGSNIMHSILQCSIGHQCLVVRRRATGNGYVEAARTAVFNELNSAREKMGIYTYRTPKARTRCAGIAKEHIYTEDQMPDLKFTIFWKTDSENLFIQGQFMGEFHNLLEYPLDSEIAQRLIDIFSDRKSYAILYAKKMEYLESKETKKKKDKLWDPKLDKLKDFTMTDLKKDLSNKVNTLNQKIISIVSEHLHLEGIPEDGAWAYKFDVKGDIKMGVGTHLRIEKKE